MKNALETCATPTKPSEAHIQGCQDQQRQAMDHLIAHIRQRIAEVSATAFADSLRECNSRRKQLEKALELYKQADTKFQILIDHFGGGQ